MSTTVSIIERIHRNTETGAPSGCWLWSGKLNRTGYGLLHVATPGKRTHWVLAHRAAYQAFNGVCLTSDVHVLHRCDTPACVNPEHMFLGDQLANMRDMDRKGRRRTACRVGVRNGRAKLTPDMVRRIREARGGGASLRALARRFGVGAATIYGVVHAQTWAHVQ